MSDPDQSLEIFIIGGREGESIVIRTPGGRFGIVDSYALDWTNGSTNPALMRLEALGAQKLHFVALTHPHMDHFRGLPTVFESYPGQIEWFWRPPWGTVDLFRDIRREFKAATTHEGRNYLGHSVKILRKLFEMINSEIASKRLKLKTLQNDSDCEAAYDGVMLREEEHDFSIMCIGPSTNISTPYLEKAAQKTVIPRNPNKPPKWGGRHNEISSVLAVKYGSWVGVLGGDTEEPSWKDIIHRRVKLLNSTRLFKVAHHGSETSSFPELWDTIQSDTCEAVITCFARQGLPNAEGLQYLRHPRFSLHSTNSALANQLYKKSETEKESSNPIPYEFQISELAGEVRIGVNPDGKMSFDYFEPAGPLTL